MKKRRTTFMAVIMTAVMMLATVMPVMATDPGTGGGTGSSVSEVTSVDLTKILELSDGLNAPPENFSFTVSPFNGNLNAPSGATEYDNFTVEEGAPGGLMYGDHETFTISSADASTPSGKKVSLNIHKNQFTHAGIYRYKVVETKGTTAGMTYDKNTYYVDVYILNNTSTDPYSQYCGGFGIFTIGENGTVNAKAQSLTFNNSFKNGENELNLHDVDVTKEITGNQSNLSDTFEFIVNYSVSDNRTLKYSTIKEDTTNTSLDRNWQDIQSGESITLGNNETFWLRGLAQNDTFSIEEKQTGTYIGSISGDIEVAAQNAGVNVSTGEQTMGTKNVSMTFTNTKSGNVPTGIFLNYKPFWIMGAVALVLLAVFMGRRKNRYEEEL